MLDCAFELQESISLCLRLNVHDVARIVSLPGKSTVSSGGGNGSHEKEGSAASDGGGQEREVVVDEARWVYEQLRCEI